MLWKRLLDDRTACNQFAVTMREKLDEDNEFLRKETFFKRTFIPSFEERIQNKLATAPKSMRGVAEAAATSSSYPEVLGTLYLSVVAGATGAVFCQQGGAPPHWRLAVSAFLRPMASLCWPHLLATQITGYHTSGFFLWGHVKHRM